MEGNSGRRKNLRKKRMAAARGRESRGRESPRRVQKETQVGEKPFQKKIYRDPSKQIQERNDSVVVQKEKEEFVEGLKKKK